MRIHRPFRPVLAVLALAATLACGSYGGSAVSTGEWGGHNADLLVTSSGATATFKCGAAGTIPQPLALDGMGRFDATGTYDPRVVAGGPRSARYVGTVNGQTMTLDVTVSDGPVGSFALTAGQPAQIDVCNF